MKLVWLLKSDSPNQSYEEILKANTFSVETIPTLEFENIGKEDLEEALKNSDDYGGIIFTSVRGVLSVSNVLNDGYNSFIDRWVSKWIFVVGKATSNAVKEKLNLDAIGRESGNAKQLGEIIVKHCSPSDKPLLYICGNLKRDDLPDILKQNNLNFKLLICYKTVRHHSLENRISELYARQKPDFIVFFSPSGIEFSIPIFKKMEISLVNNNFIALGATTKNTLLSYNMNVYGVCSEPSPAGLIEVFQPR